MANIADFHDVTFPTDIALGASGGPQRNTEILTLGSGHEQRNQRWSQSRRRFDAGYGVKNLNALHEVVAFYEARRGPLFAFRFRDPTDWKSTAPLSQSDVSDQQLGIGDGQKTSFQMIKSYGDGDQAYHRTITKPVPGSVSLSVGGEISSEGEDYQINYLTGEIIFTSAPPVGANISCGFRFDVPVRFESDQLNINLLAFSAGDLPSIPLVEVRA